MNKRLINQIAESNRIEKIDSIARIESNRIETFFARIGMLYPVNHPAYSPDLAPSDHFLIRNLSYHLRGTSFRPIVDESLKIAVKGQVSESKQKILFSGHKQLTTKVENMHWCYMRSKLPAKCTIKARANSTRLSSCFACSTSLLYCNDNLRSSTKVDEELPAN